MDVVDPVRRRHAHLRRERDELRLDAERPSRRRGEIGLALAELDPRDVVAVRRRRDRDRDLRRIDVTARLRRHDAHGVARDGELRVPRAHEPATEPRT